MKERILIVDDDKYISLLLYNFLDDEGYICETAENGLEALNRVKSGTTYDIILLDFVMPKMNGLEFLAALREADPKPPVMMISGYRTRENTLEALKLGAIGFIKKPFSLSDMLKSLRMVLQASSSKKEPSPIVPFLKKGAMEFDFKTGSIEPDKVALYLATHLGEMGFVDGRRTSTVALAFNEIITNAVEHGNLELPVNYFLENPGSETRETVADQGAERLRSERYAERSISIQYSFEGEETRVTVGDEGPGFDVSCVRAFLDSGDEATAADHIGRSLMLIKHAVDEVLFNEKGNELTVVIRSTGGH